MLKVLSLLVVFLGASLLSAQPLKSEGPSIDTGAVHTPEQGAEEAKERQHERNLRAAKGGAIGGFAGGSTLVGVALIVGMLAAGNPQALIFLPFLAAAVVGVGTSWGTRGFKQGARIFISASSIGLFFAGTILGITAGSFSSLILITGDFLPAGFSGTLAVWSIPVITIIGGGTLGGALGAFGSSAMVQLFDEVE